ADTPSADIYPLSLHDALPIFGSASGATGAASVTTGALAAASSASFCRRSASRLRRRTSRGSFGARPVLLTGAAGAWVSTSASTRSEEHTSELQSRENLVCRLL